MRNIAIAVIITIAIVGLLAWYAFRQAEPVDPIIEAPQTSEPRQPAEVRPEEPDVEPREAAATEPVWPDFALPSLDESDSVIRDVWQELADEPLRSRIQGIQHYIRKAVTAADMIARGQNPYKQIYAFRPGGEFLVEQRGDRLFLAVDNYQRFDALVQASDELDGKRLGQLYRHIEPLLEKAYGELGNSDRTWKQTLMETSDQILQFDVPELPPEIIGREGVYIYKDPELEQLPPVQKLLLRMGRDHALTIQGKVRAFRESLD